MKKLIFVSPNNAKYQLVTALDVAYNIIDNIPAIIIGSDEKLSIQVSGMHMSLPAQDGSKVVIANLHHDLSLYERVRLQNIGKFTHINS